MCHCCMIAEILTPESHSSVLPSFNKVLSVGFGIGFYNQSSSKTRRQLLQTALKSPRRRRRKRRKTGSDLIAAAKENFLEDAKVAAFILNMESFFTLKEELGVLVDIIFIMLYYCLVLARILWNSAVLLGFPQFSDTQLMLPPEFMGSLDVATWLIWQ